MGIELKDLQPGSFYKGYHAPAPQGQRCFYFVESNIVQGALVQVRVLCHPRASSTAGWVPMTFTGPANQESLVKRPSSLTDLGAAGITSLVPRGSAFAQAAPNAVPPPVAVAAPATPAAAAPVETAGKVAIPENAHSPTCVKCGGANKAIVMFSSTTYTCTNCEPQ